VIPTCASGTSRRKTLDGAAVMSEQDVMPAATA